MNQILRARLANQHLLEPRLSDPGHLVAELGAVQSQDYTAAKWALGLRLRDATDASIEDAFNAGKFLRTHVLRPTWHFVAPADIRWMLELTSPRVKAAFAAYARTQGLDDRFLTRASRVIERELIGGKHLTRSELGAALDRAGVDVPNAVSLGHVLGQAELEGLVCSGPRRGVQHTYALLEERVAPAPRLTRDEALAELTWRYFSSHGPALVQDCGWWSGLTLRDVRRGLELNGERLDRLEVDGLTYWSRPTSSPTPGLSAHLLPNFDEYTVAYRERDLFYDKVANFTGDPRRDVPFSDVILLDGRVVGGWKRSSPKEVRWSVPPGPAECAAVESAAERYTRFIGP